MEYRRQVTVRRDGDDFVVASHTDGLIIFRNNDAHALRKLCRSLRWEVIHDTTGSPDHAAWPLVPEQPHSPDDETAPANRTDIDSD